MSSAKPAWFKQLDGPPPLLGRDGARARGLDHRRELDRDHEHGPPHTQHAHELLVVVQGALDLGD